MYDWRDKEDIDDSDGQRLAELAGAGVVSAQQDERDDVTETDEKAEDGTERQVDVAHTLVNLRRRQGFNFNETFIIIKS